MTDRLLFQCLGEHGRRSAHLSDLEDYRSRLDLVAPALFQKKICSGLAVNDHHPQISLFQEADQPAVAFPDRLAVDRLNENLAVFRLACNRKRNILTVRSELDPGKQLQVDWKDDIKFVFKTGEVLDFNLIQMPEHGDFSVRVPVSSNNEVGTLARSFNEMANSLSVSETTRRNFIANVSHELKTPMTTIAGFIDGILDGTIPQDKQKQYLRIVSNEVKRLSRLVASMLSLSRIDNGELHLNKQPFNISDVVISTLLTFEQKIEQHHIDVKGLESCMTPVTVNGDPDLIYQVVYNLFENAVFK